MKNEKATGYIAIPKIVAQSKKLSATAKILYGVLLDRAETKGYCDYTNGQLAERLNVSEQEIDEALQGLSTGGFIATNFSQ